jgi:hypothetical protein
MRNFKNWIGLVAGLFALVVSGVWAEDASKLRTVRVQGEGKITAVPDQAEIVFGVVEDSAQLKDASAKARKKMQAIFAAIKSFGISEKDFQTIDYNIQPKYKYDKNGNEVQRIGYTVTNRIKVLVKDLDQVGQVLEAVTEKEVGQVEGPNFGFSDPSKLGLEALKAAMADAHTKAETLARSGDAELDKVFSINQISSYMPTPRPMMAFKAMETEGNAPPVARGQSDVNAQVEVVYLLK